MSHTIHVACGNVPWEGDILNACARREHVVVQRHVELRGLSAAIATADPLTARVIVSPALRGFAESEVQQVAAALPTLVLLDGIEPPWLAESGLHVRRWDRSGTLPEFDSWFTPAVASVHTTPRQVTTFVGVSGGIGTTSLAAAYAVAQGQSLLIEANTTCPAVAIAAGLPPELVTAEAVPAPMLSGVLVCADAAVGGMVGSAAAGVPLPLVVDAGVFGEPGSSEPLTQADTVVLVAEASAVGMVRLCRMAPELRAFGERLTVVVNRVRPSAVGAHDPAAAMQTIVREVLDVDPVCIADDPAGFDAAWLYGRWSGPALIVRAGLAGLRGRAVNDRPG